MNTGNLLIYRDFIHQDILDDMRNADLTIDEDEAADLLKEIQKQLKLRQWGEVIRLEADDGMISTIRDFRQISPSSS